MDSGIKIALVSKEIKQNFEESVLEVVSRCLVLSGGNMEMLGDMGFVDYYEFLNEAFRGHLHRPRPSLTPRRHNNVIV